MRVAELSDIHGNVRALEAVLADMGRVDLVVANGDLLAYGPSPAETLAALRGQPNVLYVSGNNDRYLVERRWEGDPGDGWEAEAVADVRPSYIILDDSTGKVELDVRRVTYDADAAMSDLEHGRVPFGQVIAFQIRNAALMPKHETDYARRDLVRYAE